ncbi:unnamed protein product [Musa banksii]
MNSITPRTSSLPEYGFVKFTSKDISRLQKISLLNQRRRRSSHSLINQPYGIKYMRWTAVVWWSHAHDSCFSVWYHCLSLMLAVEAASPPR